MASKIVRYAVSNPRPKTRRVSSTPRITAHPLIGESREMSYATRIGRTRRGPSIIVRRVYMFHHEDLLKVVRHAIHSGFTMGRGRR